MARRYHGLDHMGLADTCGAAGDRVLWLRSGALEVILVEDALESVIETEGANARAHRPRFRYNRYHRRADMWRPVWYPDRILYDEYVGWRKEKPGLVETRVEAVTRESKRLPSPAKTQPRAIIISPAGQIEGR
jgi:hypothetical protein